MWKFKWFGKKEEKIDSQETDKEELKLHIIRRIKRLRFKRGSIYELSDILREFFSGYFALGYEFTFEELKDELENMKIKRIVIESVKYVLENLDNKKFGGAKITKKEFIEIAEEVELLINIL